jgi:hypothetical protein
MPSANRILVSSPIMDEDTEISDVSTENRTVTNFGWREGNTATHAEMYQRAADEQMTSPHVVLDPDVSAENRTMSTVTNFGWRDGNDATHAGMHQRSAVGTIASPDIMGDPATSLEMYQQKRLVVEKVSPTMSHLKGDLDYTKAKNRELRRVASQERERVSWAYIERGYNSS